MNSFTTLSTSSVVLLATFFITSCSSGGGGSAPAVTSYTGSTTAATIDDSNAAAIGTAAGESIQIANSSNGLPFGITINNNTANNLTEINKIILSNLDIASLPAGVDISAQFCTSGTASRTDPGNVQSGPVDVTATFNNCVFAGSYAMTISGSLKIHYDDVSKLDDFSVIYTNFTVTDANGTTTINMTMICTAVSCTYNSDFEGTDGTTHRVTNFAFSGDTTYGFDGTATFYHGTYGSVSITAIGITYGSCGTYPDGGEISFSSNGSSGTIIFASDCSVSGTWNNGVTTGSF